MRRIDRRRRQKLHNLKDKLVRLIAFIGRASSLAPHHPFPVLVADTTSLPDTTRCIRPNHDIKTVCLDRDWNTCVVTATQHNNEVERYDPTRTSEEESDWQSTNWTIPVYTEALYMFNPSNMCTFDWKALESYFPQVHERLSHNPLHSNIITLRGDLGNF